MCLLMMQCIPSVALNMCCNCSRYHAHHFECNILARLLPNKTSNHRNQHILKRKKSKTTNKPSDIEIMQTCFFVTQKAQLTLPQPFLRKSTKKDWNHLSSSWFTTTFFFANGPLKPGGITDRSTSSWNFVSPFRAKWRPHSWDSLFRMAFEAWRN